MLLPLAALRPAENATLPFLVGFIFPTSLEKEEAHHYKVLIMARFCLLTLFVATFNPFPKYFQLNNPLADVETEAQRSKATCTKLQWWNQDLNLVLLDSKVYSLILYSADLGKVPSSESEITHS
jgi:hypothetical protein